MACGWDHLGACWKYRVSALSSDYDITTCILTGVVAIQMNIIIGRAPVL